MKMKHWLAGLAVSAALLGLTGPASAQDSKKDAGHFGALEAQSKEVVQAKALAWLKKATNNDAARISQFDKIWARSDRSVLDNLADTFGLVNGQAEALLKLVRDPLAPAPVGIPEVLKDTKITLYDDWKGRFQENSDKMRTGSITEVARVFKSLSHLALQKNLSYRERRMLDKAKYLIVSEIAEVERMPVDQVEAKIDRAVARGIKQVRDR